jgi:hypothetical protein
MVSPGVRGLAYIALQEAPQPSDQTGLDLWFLFILKGGGGRIRELTPDWSNHWGGRLGPGATAPPVSLNGPPL